MFTYRTHLKKYSIRPSKFSFSDLKRICLEGIEINQTAIASEKSYYEKMFATNESDTSQEQKEKSDKLLTQVKSLNSSKVAITVEGSMGETFTIIPGGTLDGVFSDLSMPQKITKIKFDNWSNFQIFESRLPNFRFSIELDLSDMPVWKFTERQKNTSFIEVASVEHENWHLGSLEKLRRSVERKRSLVANFIHKYLKYDLIVWLVGIPMTLLSLRMFAPQSLTEAFPGFQAVASLAACLLALVFFRAFHQYLQWLFPFLELDEQPKEMQALQRGVATFIALGIISGWLALVGEFLVKAFR